MRVVLFTAIAVIVTLFGQGFAQNFGDNHRSLAGSAVELLGTVHSTISALGVSATENVFAGALGGIEKIYGSTRAVYQVATGPNVGGITSGLDGDIFFTDTTSCKILKVSEDGSISTVIGTGVCLQSEDLSLVGSSTPVNSLHAVYLDTSRSPPTMYFTEYSRDLVRSFNLISSSDGSNGVGQLSTFVGSTSQNAMHGFSGDGGKATTALLNHPRALSMDPFGNLFIADSGNGCIRRVSRTTGIITSMGHSLFTGIVSLAADGSGFVYTTSSVHAYVTRANFRDGVVDVFAGTGENNGYAVPGSDPLLTPVEWNTHLAISDTTMYMAMPLSKRVLGVSVPASSTPRTIHTHAPNRSPRPAPAPVTDRNQTLRAGIRSGSCSFASTQGEEVVCSFVECRPFSLSATTCANSFTGDTYLTLYSPRNNSILAINDDNGDGTLCSTIARFTTTSTSCEEYYIKQRCYAEDACSGTTSFTIDYRAVAVNDNDDHVAGVTMNTRMSMEMIAGMTLVVVTIASCIGAAIMGGCCCTHMTAPYSKKDVVPVTEFDEIPDAAILEKKMNSSIDKEIELTTSLSSGSASSSQSFKQVYTYASYIPADSYVNDGSVSSVKSVRQQPVYLSAENCYSPSGSGRRVYMSFKASTALPSSTKSTKTMVIGSSSSRGSSSRAGSASSTNSGATTDTESPRQGSNTPASEPEPVTPSDDEVSEVSPVYDFVVEEDCD